MKVGDLATLIRPYRGYRNIELVERLQYTWLVRICELNNEALSKTGRASLLLSNILKRMKAMTTTAIQPWECHVPKSVSLYFVDYNESLDEHEDLQEKCIRQNSMLPLDEESSEWYSEQFSENLRTEMRDIKESMEKAGLGTDYVETSVTCSMSGMTPIRLKA